MKHIRLITLGLLGVFGLVILPAFSSVKSKAENCTVSVTEILANTKIGNPSVNIPASLIDRSSTLIPKLIDANYSYDQAYNYSMDSLSPISDYYFRDGVSTTVANLVQNPVNECR